MQSHSSPSEVLNALQDDDSRHTRIRASSVESIDSQLDLDMDARMTGSNGIGVDRPQRPDANHFGEFSDPMLSEIGWEQGLPTYLIAPRLSMVLVANPASLLRGLRRSQAQQRIGTIRAHLWANRMVIAPLRLLDFDDADSDYDSESTRVSTTSSLTPSVISESGLSISTIASEASQ